MKMNMNNKIVVAIIVGALIIGGFFYISRTKQSSPNSFIPSTSTVADNCDNPRIKGNISSSGERIYHVPSGQYYSVTQINESKGEMLFCTEAEARSAGWRKSLR